MKTELSVKCGIIEAALSPLLGVVERKKSFPILSNILVTAIDGEHLEFVGTDLELELVTCAKIERAPLGLAVTIPARKLYEIVRAFDEETILHWLIEGDHLTIKAPTGRFKLSCLPVTEFSRFEHDCYDFEIVLNAAELKEALSDVVFAVANQDVRYYLNGVLFDFSPDGISLVGTDGHRLAISKLSMGIECATAGRQAIVPRKAIQELVKALEGGEQQVTLSVGGHSIRFLTPNLSLASKLIEGKYPNYKTAIPNSHLYELKLKKNILKQALQQASILIQHQLKGVNFVLENNRLSIETHQQEQDQAELILDVAFEGGPVRIGFNVDYLLDSLQVVKGSELILHLKDNATGVIVEEPGRENHVQLLMPLCL